MIGGEPAAGPRLGCRDTQGWVWEGIAFTSEFGSVLKTRFRAGVGVTQSDLWFQMIALASVQRMNFKG